MAVSHQGLAKGEEMFVTVVSHQRFHDGLLRGSDAPVSEISQLLRITLTRQNGVEDGQTGGPGDVADHVMNLKVHLVQRLLHVLQMNRGHLDQAVAMTPQTAEGTDLLIGAKRASEEPHRVQVLQPLTIRHVALSTRHVFYVSGIDQASFDAVLLQNLEQRNPVNSGGFHRHGSNPAALQPVSQSF
jgi:hypothetical protein